MSGKLQISIGQFSDKGRKETNQDFHGVLIPDEPLLGMKGVAIVIADGISSSDVSQIASESAVKALLTDYYCTSESWSVKTSAQRVLAATNSWLNAQTRAGQYSYDRDRGYVCTLSAMVIKSATAHIFHVGDSRIYRSTGKTLELLTEDHRVVVSSQQHYLSRALGIHPQLEIDYRALEVQQGDVFVLATDGVYEHIAPRHVVETIGAAKDLEQAAKLLVEKAYENGSLDNLTIQIVRIDSVPDGEASEITEQPSELPPAPLLQARMVFERYEIIRELHASSRSHIYLAMDTETRQLAAMKIPSIDLRDDPAYLKRFMMEEWVARRIDSPHVLRPRAQSRQRNYLYVVSEYVEGETLAQWMIDHPQPDIEAVRNIVEQIASGLRAFHRMEMLHQDIRPDNIMIDTAGTVKIIDFGSVQVAGVLEAQPAGEPNDILGTVQYTAPEYFLGDGGSSRSDMFSLGVIAYQMLTGRLPYGAELARMKPGSRLKALKYRSVRDEGRDIPLWIDGAIRRAVHPDPLKRYEEISEFIFDLRHPNAKYLASSPEPLLQRNPLLFWQVVTIVLAGIVIFLLARLHGS